MGLKINLLSVIIFAVCLKYSSAVDYCHIKSCRNRPHTVCSYPNAAPSQCCTGHQGSGLSNDEQNKIVNLHNQLRQLVASGRETRGSPGPQPPAKYMANLQWDDELANIAQRWADQCNWGHDQCRDVERFGVGQNIAVIGTTGNVRDIRVESMIQSWYDEVKDFSRNDVARFNNRGANGRAIGHYTQMVWAKSIKIGCGGVKYKDGQWNKFYLVCNYGSAGNFLDQPVYETR